MCEDRDNRKKKYRIRQFEDSVMQTSFNHLQMCHHLQQLHQRAEAQVKGLQYSDV